MTLALQVLIFEGIEWRTMKYFFIAFWNKKTEQICRFDEIAHRKNLNLIVKSTKIKIL